jgi:uncharacterized protein YbjT (DUF2867 family)/plastocyanin
MKILLTGASGFVGSTVLSQLLSEGHNVRVLVRDSESFEKLELKHQVEAFYGNILYAPSIAGCMSGIEAVIHLVGIIAEVGENTFDRVHRVGTQNLVTEAKKAKVKRFIHMSALGVRPNARSKYHQSKWEGEEIVRNSGLDWTIFRPSIIYGRGDGFVNLFSRMNQYPWKALQLFTMPLIEGGQTHLQPIPVSDVARAFVGALQKPEALKKTYDLCGPEPLRLKEIIKTIVEVQGSPTQEMKRPFYQWIGDWSNLLIPFAALQGLWLQPRVLLVPVPYEFARIIAWIMEAFMTKPLLNRDQLIMLEEDNVGDPSEAVKDFGIHPPDFRSGIQYIAHPTPKKVRSEDAPEGSAVAVAGIVVAILLFGMTLIKLVQPKEEEHHDPIAAASHDEHAASTSHAPAPAAPAAPTETAATTPAPSGPAAAPAVTAGGDGLSGKVTLTGTPPTEKPIKMVSECHGPANLTTRHYEVDGSGNLANVVVYVKDGLAGLTIPPPSNPAVIDQQQCLYVPYVVAVQTGQMLNIKNSDAVQHNVHALPDGRGAKNKEFNIGQNAKGPDIQKTFNKPEVFIKLKCDVHPWMLAYVAVLDHPYFAITSADGSFKISGLPDGQYTLAAVHPKAGEQTAKVDLKGGAQVNFAFTPK